MRPSSVAPHLDVPLPHHCPVTGLPVFSHSSWTYTSPGGGYRLRVSFIGDRIMWLQPQGYVLLRHAQKGMALVEDVLLTMLPGASDFIALDDFSAVAGAALDARRFIIQTLRRQQRLKAYIVCNPTKLFRMGFELSRHLGLFRFEVQVAADYTEGVAIAHARARQMTPSPDMPETRSKNAPNDIEVTTDAHRASGPAAPLDRYAAELLEHVGNINLETYGIPSTYRWVPPHHPFRPVFDALSLLREDMQAILRRHREARENLESRQKELVEKQAMLNETHTTLHILLDAREKELQRLEERIRDRFHDLLAPLMDEIERTLQTARQRVLMRLLRDVTGRIGTLPPYDPYRLQTPFTARENMVAFLIKSGLNPREIADILRLSRRTIENHCQRMRGKAGLTGQPQTLRSWLTRSETSGRIPAGRTP